MIGPANKQTEITTLYIEDIKIKNGDTHSPFLSPIIPRARCVIENDETLLIKFQGRGGEKS